MKKIHIAQTDTWFNIKVRNTYWQIKYYDSVYFSYLGTSLKISNYEFDIEHWDEIYLKKRGKYILFNETSYAKKIKKMNGMTEIHNT